jgi:hypothetical protein
MSTSRKILAVAVVMVLAGLAVLTFVAARPASARPHPTLVSVCAEDAIHPLSSRTISDAASLAPALYSQCPSWIARIDRANDVLAYCGPLALSR